MHRTLTAAAALALSAHAALAQCTPQWDDRFNYGYLGYSGSVQTCAVFDDGSGPALYVGGAFASYQGTALNFIAKWDGHTFQPVGQGFDSSVFSLLVWDDDGPGPHAPALYAGGWFRHAGDTPASCIAKWDGHSWSALPGTFATSGPISYSGIRTMCLHNDGVTTRLIVGGSFTSIDGVPFNNLAAFDGNSWSVINGGVTDTDGYAGVYALASLNEPQGPALYVGGDFTHAGQTPAPAIARYRNGSWTPLEQAISAWWGRAYVQTLTAANLPTTGGPCIIAGGSFSSAGSHPVAGIAKWSGTRWNPLEHDGQSGPWGNVRMVGVADLGNGPALYASNFEGLERWNGVTWDLIAAGAFRAYAMAADTQSPQRKLYVVGEFLQAGDVAAPNVAVYDGSTVSGIGAVNQGLSAPAKAFTVGDLGQGTQLYALGDFTHGSGILLNHAARWTGSAWAPIGTGLPDYNTNGDRSIDYRSLTIHDDGSGPHLYAAEFWNGVYRLNNNGAWQHLGPLGGYTMGTFAFDTDGPGPLPESLFVFGFLRIAGEPARLARWTGSQWENTFPLGDYYPTIYAARTFDPDGPGPAPAALYLAGYFDVDGVRSAIMKWDGQIWTPQAVPYTDFDGPAYAFAIHDDGTGPTLYAAGWFSSSTLMRLRDNDWQPYGDAARPFVTYLSGYEPPVRALVSVNSGNGPELVMAGTFDYQWGTLPVYRDGAWTRYDYNVGYTADFVSTFAATTFNDGSGLCLFVGGDFDWPGQHVARLNLCTLPCTSDFNNDGDYGTDADIEAFFACLAGNCCPRCGPADFNNDGDTGTDSDIESFFRVLAGGPC